MDRVVGLNGVRVDVATVWTADGHGRFKLNAPANALGILRIMFVVADVEEVLARLRTHGAEFVVELEQYEDSYRLG